MSGGAPGVERLTGHIGAELSGVELASVDADLAGQIHAALMRYGVLFFRGQHLDDAQHLALAEHYGTPSVHPVEAFFGSGTALQTIEDKEGSRPQNSGWHTDVTYLPEPPRYAVLRSLEIPEVGGDTLWCDMAGAYDALSEPLKRLLEELTALHDAKMRANLAKRNIGTGSDLIDRIEAAFPPAEHPVVKTHPITGRKVLYVNGAFTTRIPQLSEAESRALLDRLLQHINTPDFHCRYRWTEGDVAIWDEVATQHYALPDHYPRPRRMRRCTVDGARLGLQTQ